MPAAFPEIAKIKYEGPQSKNPLSFKHYDAAATELANARTIAFFNQHLA